MAKKSIFFCTVSYFISFDQFSGTYIFLKFCFVYLSCAFFVPFPEGYIIIITEVKVLDFYFCGDD